MDPRTGGAPKRRTPLLIALCLGALLVGCAHAEPALIGRGKFIHEVRFEGNKALSKSKLLAHLRAGETSWLPLTPDYPYDEALIDADVRRIEKLYEAYGYHDARVVGRRTQVDDDDVVLTIRIDEGEPTRIDAIKFVWAADTKLSAKQRAEIEATSDVRVGDIFAIPRLNASIGSIRQELHLRGHPLGFVQGQADVRADLHKAAVVLEVNPGAWARIGKVRLEGLHLVPAYMVQREVKFALGKPYSPALVNQVERAINAMRVFRWVASVPAQQVKNGEMELVMRLSEADPESLKLGALVDFQSARWQQSVSALYTHTNLFGNLTRFELRVVAGAAELPDFIHPDQMGPVFTVAPGLTKKGLLEDHLIWTLEPRWDMDVRDGYQFQSPSNRMGVSRWFAGMVRLGLSHNLRYVDFFNLSNNLQGPGATLLGLDFHDPYVLSYLEFKASLFMSDSIVAPHNGVIVEGTYDLAGGVLQGDYDYHKFEGVVRGYWRPWPRLQLAARVNGGIFLRYGDQAGVPFNYKFYLGGASSVRGWGSRRLSPKLFACEGGGTDCHGTPIGGLSMLQANFELRVRTFGDLYVVGFADMGDVQSAEVKFVPKEWNYSAGPGLRYDSPIGLVRLDVGFRLNDTGIYDEPPWGLYFGFGETF